MLAFKKVEDPTPGKNKVALDLTSTDVDAEVDRLVAAGATLVERRGEEGFRWVTMSDPDSNLFDVASAAEAATQYVGLTRRLGSPRSIGAKRGVLATDRREAANLVGRTSWGVSDAERLRRLAGRVAQERRCALLLLGLPDGPRRAVQRGERPEEALVRLVRPRDRPLATPARAP